MPKSRQQLIKEIKEARKNARSNLMYVKGLTKMKKEELKEIADMLGEVKTNLREEDDPKYERERERLEEEKQHLERELGELEDEEEQHKVELEELDLEEEDDEGEEEGGEEEEEEGEELPFEKPKLTRQTGYNKLPKEDLPPKEEDEDTEIDIQEMEDDYNDEDDDELVDAEEFLKSIESTLNKKQNVKKITTKEKPKKENKVKESKRKNNIDEEQPKKKERKQRVRMTKKEVEADIKTQMSNFSTDLSIKLKPFQRKYRNGTLDTHDIDDIVDTHNDLRENTKDKIELLMEELEEGEDLSERFYRYVNDYFDRQLARVERLIK